jgi:hypothetical protein
MRRSALMPARSVGRGGTGVRLGGAFGQVQAGHAPPGRDEPRMRRPSVWRIPSGVVFTGITSGRDHPYSSPHVEDRSPTAPGDRATRHPAVRGRCGCPVRGGGRRVDGRSGHGRLEPGADLAQRESASRSRSSSMAMLPGSPSCVRSIMTLPLIMTPWPPRLHVERAPHPGGRPWLLRR